jgi:hypothetical protein
MGARALCARQLELGVLASPSPLPAPYLQYPRVDTGAFGRGSVTGRWRDATTSRPPRARIFPILLMLVGLETVPTGSDSQARTAVFTVRERKDQK